MREGKIANLEVAQDRSNLFVLPSGRAQFHANIYQRIETQQPGSDCHFFLACLQFTWKLAESQSSIHRTARFNQMPTPVTPQDMLAVLGARP